MTQVKGFAIRGILKTLKESGWSIPETLTSLPEAERQPFARPIVASSWYPYSSFAALCRTTDGAISPSAGPSADTAPSATSERRSGSSRR